MHLDNESVCLAFLSEGDNGEKSVKVRWMIEWDYYLAVRAS